MNKTEHAQLEQEQVVGRRADGAYNTFIKSFIQSKKSMLIESFVSCGIGEVDTILEIKRTIYVLDALESDINTLIDTGKMASRSLNNEPMEKH